MGDHRCPCNAWGIYFCRNRAVVKFPLDEPHFGGLLVFTGAKMAFVTEEKIELGNNILVRLAGRYFQAAASS